MNFTTSIEAVGTPATFFSKQEEQKKIFLENFYKGVAACIANATNIEGIPGVDAKAFQELKPELYNILDNLQKYGHFEKEGTDKETRIFVAFQALIEDTLAEKLRSEEIETSEGFGTTPLPLTPLCKEGRTPGLMHSDIENDPKRSLTVDAREHIIRKYLANNGLLLGIYPKAGYEKRDKEQKAIYQNSINTFKGKFFDYPIENDIDPNLIGAHYFFKDAFNNVFFFSIQMTQALDSSNKTGGLWFGSVDHPSLKHRIAQVNNFLLPEKEKINNLLEEHNQRLINFI